MNAALRWMVHGEDRLISKIDHAKRIENIRRGSKRKGTIKINDTVIKRKAA